MSASPFVTVDEAAAYLHCHRATVYRLLNREAFVARRIGARTLIERASIEAYVAKLPVHTTLTLPVTVERMERKSRPPDEKGRALCPAIRLRICISASASPSLASGAGSS